MGWDQLDLVTVHHKEGEGGREGGREGVRDQIYQNVLDVTLNGL